MKYTVLTMYTSIQRTVDQIRQAGGIYTVSTGAVTLRGFAQVTGLRAHCAKGMFHSTTIPTQMIQSISLARLSTYGITIVGVAMRDRRTDLQAIPLVLSVDIPVDLSKERSRRVMVN